MQSPESLFGVPSEPSVEVKEFAYTRVAITSDTSDATIEAADKEIARLQTLGKVIIRHTYLIMYTDPTPSR